MALGAVANLIVGSIAFCLSNLELLSFLGIFALCNWYKTIANLLPIGKRDGAVCLRILRERNK
jgi:Zn-dependent protease